MNSITAGVALIFFFFEDLLLLFRDFYVGYTYTDQFYFIYKWILVCLSVRWSLIALETVWPILMTIVTYMYFMEKALSGFLAS